MTLVVAISRRDEYALVTADSIVFTGSTDEPREKWHATGLAVTDKVERLTDRVLLAVTGDDGVCDDFRARIRERARPGDDLDACRELAGAVIGELLEADDPESLYRKDDAWWARGSVRDERGFSVILNGFRDSGGSAIATSNGATFNDTASDPVLGQTAMSVPYGVPQAEIDQFHGLPAADVAELVALHGAFQRAFSVHHYIGAHYGDRVSRDVRCSILVGGSFVTFELDRDDIETFQAIYRMLRCAGGPP